LSDQFLQEVQALQFRDLDTANQRLGEFFRDHWSPDVAEVVARPSAVSLNSINGMLTLKTGQRFFFKTHVEPQSLIHEYYNAGLLAEVGYPVIQPVAQSTAWGKQFLIYDYFEAPCLFDWVWALDNGQAQDDHGAAVIAAQHQADDGLWHIYQHTLKPLAAQDNRQAPVHQLFSHRLTGGRYQQFYQGAAIALPGQTLAFEDLANKRWVINGIPFCHTLGELIRMAIQTLDPSQNTPAIVGHGDAHNGNVFWDQARGQVIYFDPAFAGRHSPFLDLAKPLFHNVFATWMYFPQAIAQTLTIDLTVEDNWLVVNHDFVPSPLRLEFLHSKLERVLHPLLQEIHARNLWVEGWREILKLALFCCPFLTMNLGDRGRFPPTITLLGLALAVEMGSTGMDDHRSFLDRRFDAIAEP